MICSDGSMRNVFLRCSWTPHASQRTSARIAQWKRATKSWWVTYIGNVNRFQKCLNEHIFAFYFSSMSYFYRWKLCKLGVSYQFVCCSVLLLGGPFRYIHIQVGNVWSATLTCDGTSQWITAVFFANVSLLLTLKSLVWFSVKYWAEVVLHTSECC